MHYYILESIHVEVATIARGPWSDDARSRGCFHPPPGVGGPSVEQIRFDDADSSLTSCVDSANLSAEKLVAPFPLLSLSLHSYPGAG